MAFFAADFDCDINVPVTSSENIRGKLGVVDEVMKIKLCRVLVDVVEAAMLDATDGVQNDKASCPLDIRLVKEWVCIQGFAYGISEINDSLLGNYFSSPRITSLRFCGSYLLGFAGCRPFGSNTLTKLGLDCRSKAAAEPKILLPLG